MGVGALGTMNWTITHPSSHFSFCLGVVASHLWSLVRFEKYPLRPELCPSLPQSFVCGNTQSCVPPAERKDRLFALAEIKGKQKKAPNTYREWLLAVVLEHPDDIRDEIKLNLRSSSNFLNLVFPALMNPTAVEGTLQRECPEKCTQNINFL